MELIIKISDELFNIFKKHGIDAFDYFNEYDKDQIAIAIAHGTPYNPAGDLISREALKEKIDKKALDLANGGMIFVESINHIIDNVPAAETFTLEDMQNNFDLGAMSENGKHDTSKGEWIPMNTDCRSYSESFKCSICGAYIYPRCLEKELDYNFCPYCGADMGGKEE